VAYIRKLDECCIGNAPSEIPGVFAPDEFVMLAVHDRNPHADGCQIIRRIIGLGSLHKADRVGQVVEFVRRGRQAAVVLHVPAEAPLDDGSEFEFLCAAGIHVAPKEEHACNPCWSFRCQDN
jgi:hypothetical protein